MSKPSKRSPERKLQVVLSVLQHSSRRRLLKDSTKGVSQDAPGSMLTVGVPQMRHQSRKAAEMSSEPLSVRRCAGAALSATRCSTVATTLWASMRGEASTEWASRVNSLCRESHR